MTKRKAEQALLNNNRENPQFLGQRNNSNNFALLKSAIEKGYIERVQKLIANGFDVNVKSNDGVTLLHCAAWSRDVKMITELVRLGVDINSRDKDDVTPLFCAALYGNVEAVTKLIEFGADINIQTKDGTTPASIAIENGYSGVANALMYVQFVDNISSSKDLTLKNISKVLLESVVPTTLASQIENNIKEVLGAIITRLVKTSEDVKESLSKRIVSKLQNASFIDLKEIQQEIVHNITNLNNNMTLIREIYNIDLSFLTNDLKNFIHSKNNPNGFVHDNGIMTLSTLSLLLLAKSNQIEKVVESQPREITEKALHLFKIRGISKILSLSDDIIAELEAVANNNQSQVFIEKEASSIIISGMHIDNVD